MSQTTPRTPDNKKTGHQNKNAASGDLETPAEASIPKPSIEMQGEDYNYGGAGSSSDKKKKAATPKPAETVTKVESGPTPKSENPPQNHSSTEANWGNRTGSGMAGGIAPAEEAGDRHK